MRGAGRATWEKYSGAGRAGVGTNGNGHTTADFARSPLNTASLLERYLAYLELNTSSETLKEARYRLKGFVLRFPTLPLDLKSLNAYMDSLRGGVRTRHGLASRLRAFYTWLWQRGELDDFLIYNPFDRLRLPPVGKDVLQPLSPDQVNQLLASPPTRRHYIICRAFIEAGFRRRELCSLTVDGLEAPTGKLPGRAFATGKTGNWGVLLTPTLYRLLKSIAPASGYVFHGKTPERPLSADLVTHMVGETFAAAALKMEHNGPQILRHTFSVRMKQATSTAAAAAFTRHDVGVSMRTYGRFSDVYMGEEFTKVNESLPLKEEPWWFGQQQPLGLEDSNREEVTA